MTRLHTNVISNIKIKYDFKRELCGRVTRTRLFSHIFPRLRFFKDQVFVFAEEMVSFQEPRRYYRYPVLAVGCIHVVIAANSLATRP